MSTIRTSYTTSSNVYYNVRTSRSSLRNSRVEVEIRPRSISRKINRLIETTEREDCPVGGCPITKEVTTSRIVPITQEVRTSRILPVTTEVRTSRIVPVVEMRTSYVEPITTYIEPSYEVRRSVKYTVNSGEIKSANFDDNEDQKDQEKEDKNLNSSRVSISISRKSYKLDDQENSEKLDKEEKDAYDIHNTRIERKSNRSSNSRSSRVSRKSNRANDEKAWASRFEDEDNKSDTSIEPVEGFNNEPSNQEKTEEVKQPEEIYEQKESTLPGYYSYSYHIKNPNFEPRGIERICEPHLAPRDVFDSYHTTKTTTTYYSR